MADATDEYTDEFMIRTLTALVAAGATPRQLGAVAAALGRARQPPSGSATQPPPAVRRRAADVQRALEVQELLERRGVPHRHHFTEAVSLARQTGVLDRPASQAARHIARRANAARQNAFYPTHPPGTFHVSTDDDTVSGNVATDAGCSTSATTTSCSSTDVQPAGRAQLPPVTPYETCGEC